MTAELAGTTYKIIVEDKTYTSEHNNQLLRYKEEIQEKFPGCIPCGVYYKTGFQSDLSAVHKAKYQYVSLEKMLDLLGRYVEKTDSQILRDYYGYWNTAKFYVTITGTGILIWKTPGVTGNFLRRSGAATNAPAFSMPCRTVIF